MTRLKEFQHEVEQPKVDFKPRQPKIVGCQVKEGKLMTQLDDEREIGLPISLLTKWRVLGEKVQAEQLKNYELWGEGKTIFFPDIDEALPAWIIFRGLGFSCRV